MARIYVTRRGHVGFGLGWIGLFFYAIVIGIKYTIIGLIIAVYALVGLPLLIDWLIAKCIRPYRAKRAASIKRSSVSAEYRKSFIAVLVALGVARRR